MLTQDKLRWLADFGVSPDLLAKVAGANQSAAPSVGQSSRGGVSPKPPTGSASTPTTAPAQVPPSGRGATGQQADSLDQTDQPTSASTSLTDDPEFERLVEAMEADGDDADAEWKSQLGSMVFQFFDPAVKADYAAVGTECEKARGDFNLEWNKVVAGKGDPAKLLAAYDIFSLRIGALQQVNARIEALIAADFATMLAPLLAFVMKMKKFELARKLQRQLEALLADLDKAESAVTKAEVKAGLNVAVSAITTILAPEATLAKLLLSGGGMVAHIAIDHGLGEPTVTTTTIAVIGDSGDFIELSKHGKEAIEKLKGGSKTIGVAAAAVTAVLDVKEIYEGKEKVEHIREEIKQVRKSYDELMAGVLPMIPEFIALQKLIESLPAVVNKALAAGNDAAKNYDAIRQEIEKVIHEGS